MSSKFKIEFQEICALGSGAFSTVFEVKSIKDGKSYAVKKIPIKFEEKEKAMKEIKFLRSIKSDFVVFYIDSWIEKNYYLPFKRHYKLDRKSLLFDQKKSFLLHIQMELCLMTLDVFFKSLGNKNKNSMNIKDYSNSCDIFEQLLECVQYLHQQNPPIIHRDLKPENIMLMTVNNSYKVKLTDFGLSTYHEFVDQSHTKYIGTKKFRAPEVDTKKYDTKADIYSLGMIMELLFNINHNSDLNENDIEIKANYENVKQICLKCVSHITKQRPDCQQILNDKHLWIYNVNVNTMISEELSVRHVSVEKKVESVIKNDSNHYFKKWPLINKINRNILLRCNNISIIEELETKLIFTGNDNKIYALRLSDHIDSSVQQPVIINEFINKEIQSIVCGDCHVLCLTKDNLVYSFGDNEFRSLGNGTYMSNNKPAIIQELSDKNIIEINCSHSYSIALSISGSAFVWGNGYYGELGIGFNYIEPNPIEMKLPNSEKIITISTGHNYCLALSNCGKLYGWGKNESGELGIGSNVNQNKPILVSLDKNIIVKKIRCGINYSLILTSDNNIYSFGNNTCCQLGIGNKIKQNIPTKIKTNIKFIDIETTFCHNFSVALSSNNEYYVWGECNKDLILTPIKTKFICFNEIFIHYSYKNLLFHTISSDKKLIKKFNEKNSYNQLNENIMSSISSFQLIRIKESKALLHTNDDNVFTFRLNESIDSSAEEPVIVNELTKKRIKRIVYGYKHTLCLTETNKVYSFGNNDSGQLGNGSRIDNYKPKLIKALNDKRIVEISCGEEQCLALDKYGDLFVWGNGYYGEIGNGYNNDVLTPIAIKNRNFSNKIISISCGAHHCLALSASGVLYGWGDNQFGQLGISNVRNGERSRNKPEIISNKVINIKKISCGRYHSLILGKDHNIYSFGRNDSGQLGIGNTINQFKMNKIETSIKFIDIYTNWCDDISAGLSQTGKYYVWGDCGDDDITTPKETEFNSFDEIFVKYSNYRFTTKQIKLIYCDI